MEIDSLARPSWLSRQRLVWWLLASLLLFSAMDCASADERPASARIALHQGLAAVELNEWDLAIEAFERARQSTPEDPAVLLDLALAQDHKGGRSLIAVAWYQAYLAAAPQAEQASRVQRRITELLDGERKRAQLLLAKARETASLWSTAHDSLLAASAGVEAILGDREAAERDIGAVGLAPLRAEALLAAAEALAQAGERKSANALIRQSEEAIAGLGHGTYTNEAGSSSPVDLPFMREPLLSHLAEICALNGDYADAQRIAHLIAHDPKVKARALLRIAMIQSEAGNPEGAAWSSSVATRLDPEGDGRYAAFASIGLALVEAGRLKEAERWLAYLIPGDDTMLALQAALAAARGDFATAATEASQVGTWTLRSRLETLIATSAISHHATLAARQARIAGWSALASSLAATPALVDLPATLRADRYTQLRSHNSQTGYDFPADQREQLLELSHNLTDAAGAIARALRDITTAQKRWAATRATAAPAQGRQDG